jgi:menaquinone-specific isochorismate synthase
VYFKHDQASTMHFNLIEAPLTRSGQPTVPAALQALSESVERLFGKLADQPAFLPAGYLVRLQVDAPPVDLLAWLAAQPDAMRLYWSGRDEMLATAGIGAALEVAAQTPAEYDTLLERVADALAYAEAGVRFYGGLRFQPGPTRHPEWAAFGYGRFVAPAFEYSLAGERACLAWQFVLASAENRPIQQQQLHAQLAAVMPPAPHLLPALPPVRDRRSLPDRDDWQRQIETTLNLLQAPGLHKVVLARQSSYTFAWPLAPLALLQRLQHSAPKAFHFYFQPTEATAFLGASPERLYRRHGRNIESEALAGTRRRGRTSAEDRDLARDLFASDKEQREHRLVLERVRAGLTGLCSRVSAEPAPRIQSLEHVQHLAQALHGQLKEGISDAAIWRALHPTPAVGGWPRAAALDAIAALEPFDRGWYAGSVGWLGRDSAELAVAIRSGLAQDDRLTLYAGAGIVPGSTPAAEWQETENKLRNFGAILD